MIYGVIMAGGSGTRFWPKSTRQTPKQFLNLFGKRTMIQSTADRIQEIIPPERCMVVTNDQYIDLVKSQLPDVKPSNIIGETVAKNTAPCIAVAAARLVVMDPNAVMVVLPSDHIIEDTDSFRQVINTAAQTAREERSLVTIGISPDGPETGYGYIRFDTKTQLNRYDIPVYSVTEFTEKPDLDKARSFIESGEYLWNSGMFIWRADVILEAFEKFQPDIFKLLPGLMKESVTKEDLDTFYKASPSVSVDYGIMEQAKTVHVLPGDFGWNDVGSWKAVFEHSTKDQDKNVVHAVRSALLDSENNYIDSQSGKVIALVGVQNLAVVETESSILICNLDQSQNVKKIVEQLKNRDELKDFL